MEMENIQIGLRAHIEFRVIVRNLARIRDQLRALGLKRRWEIRNLFVHVRQRDLWTKGRSIRRSCGFTDSHRHRQHRISTSSFRSVSWARLGLRGAWLGFWPVWERCRLCVQRLRSRSNRPASAFIQATETKFDIRGHVIRPRNPVALQIACFITARDDFYTKSYSCSWFPHVTLLRVRGNILCGNFPDCFLTGSFSPTFRDRLQ